MKFNDDFNDKKFMLWSIIVLANETIIGFYIGASIFTRLTLLEIIVGLFRYCWLSIVVIIIGFKHIFNLLK